MAEYSTKLGFIVFESFQLALENGQNVCKRAVEEKLAVMQEVTRLQLGPIELQAMDSLERP